MLKHFIVWEVWECCAQKQVIKGVPVPSAGRGSNPSSLHMCSIMVVYRQSNVVPANIQLSVQPVFPHFVYPVPTKFLCLCKLLSISAAVRKNTYIKGLWKWKRDMRSCLQLAADREGGRRWYARVTDALWSWVSRLESTESCSKKLSFVVYCSA